MNEYSFDQVDGDESEMSMSPRMRPRAANNVLEGKKKIAMKFKKKREGKGDVHKGDYASVRSKEEDIDEIFRSYEEENGDKSSNEKEGNFGKFNSVSFQLFSSVFFTF